MIALFQKLRTTGPPSDLQTGWRRRIVLHTLTFDVELAQDAAQARMVLQPSFPWWRQRARRILRDGSRFKTPAAVYAARARWRDRAQPRRRFAHVPILV